MKKLLLACCLGATVATTTAIAIAQPAKSDSEQRLVYMQKSLQLTDAQVQKVKPILDNSKEQRQAVVEKYKPQFQAFHNDMKNVQDQTHAQLAGVLTPQQMQALDAQREAHKHFRGRGHGPHGYGPNTKHSDAAQPGAAQPAE
jgi:histidinol dehydrogenase